MNVQRWMPLLIIIVYSGNIYQAKKEHMNGQNWGAASCLPGNLGRPIESNP